MQETCTSVHTVGCKFGFYDVRKHFKDSFLEVPPDVLDRVQTGGEGRPIYRQPDTMLLEPCFNFSGSLYRGVILQANNVGHLLLGRFPVLNGW